MIALVTGAYRGLGLGVSENLASKNHTILMTGRNLKVLEEKRRELSQKKYDVHIFELDVSQASSVEKVTNLILKQFSKVDILINNAGIYKDGGQEGLTDFATTLTETFQTNSLGPALMIKALLPSMKKNNFGRIVNVSSGMGSLQEMEGGYIAYRTSKTALNAITRIFASETRGSNILVNSVCPGWVRTEMGGASAPRSVPEGVASIVWAAELPADGPTGGFFRDGKTLAW